MHMVLFWFLFLGCTVSAWLIGYGMGYLRGARDANTGDIPEATLVSEETGAAREGSLQANRLLAPIRNARDD